MALHSKIGFTVKRWTKTKIVLSVKETEEWSQTHLWTNRSTMGLLYWEYLALYTSCWPSIELLLCCSSVLASAVVGSPLKGLSVARSVVLCLPLCSVFQGCMFDVRVQVLHGRDCWWEVPLYSVYLCALCFSVRCWMRRTVRRFTVTDTTSSSTDLRRLNVPNLLT